jgi:hypothetical protein
MSQQFVVQLKNRPGELSHLARALCARGVNIAQIREVTVGDLVSAEIVTDCCDEDTTEVLHSMGYAFVKGATVTVELEDSPCAFAEANDRLHAAGVKLKGCCVVSRGHGRATWAIEVDKEQLARDVLGLPSEPSAVH